MTINFENFLKVDSVTEIKSEDVMCFLSLCLITFLLKYSKEVDEVNYEQDKFIKHQHYIIVCNGKKFLFKCNQ